MVRKKVEGDNKQRRAKANEARKRGRKPSEEHVTTGGSKQRHELPKQDPHHHEERMSSIHQGKQQDISPEPRPTSGER